MVHLNIIGSKDMEVEFHYNPVDDVVGIAISNLPDGIAMTTEVYREDFLQLMVLLMKNIELTKQEKK